jgi:hypothetical protein
MDLDSVHCTGLCVRVGVGVGDVYRKFIYFMEYNEFIHPCNFIKVSTHTSLISEWYDLTFSSKISLLTYLLTHSIQHSPS